MISTNVKLQSAKIKQNYQIMFHVKCMHYRHSVIHTSDIIFYFYNKIYQYSNITYFNNICATSIENENIHEFTIECTFIFEMCSIQFSHNINFKNIAIHFNAECDFKSFCAPKVSKNIEISFFISNPFNNINLESYHYINYKHTNEMLIKNQLLYYEYKNECQICYNDHRYDITNITGQVQQVISYNIFVNELSRSIIINYIQDRKIMHIGFVDNNQLIKTFTYQVSSIMNLKFHLSNRLSAQSGNSICTYRIIVCKDWINIVIPDSCNFPFVCFTNKSSTDGYSKTNILDCAPASIDNNSLWNNIFKCYMFTRVISKLNNLKNSDCNIHNCVMFSTDHIYIISECLCNDTSNIYVQLGHMYNIYLGYMNTEKHFYNKELFGQIGINIVFKMHIFISILKMISYIKFTNIKNTYLDVVHTGYRISELFKTRLILFFKFKAYSTNIKITTDNRLCLADEQIFCRIYKSFYVDDTHKLYASIKNTSASMLINILDETVYIFIVLSLMVNSLYIVFIVIYIMSLWRLVNMTGTTDSYRSVSCLWTVQILYYNLQDVQQCTYYMKYRGIFSFWWYHQTASIIDSMWPSQRIPIILRESITIKLVCIKAQTNLVEVIDQAQAILVKMYIKCIVNNFTHTHIFVCGIKFVTLQNV